MDRRFELKYVIPGEAVEQLRHHLLLDQGAFNTLHPIRPVSNIYFDTVGFDSLTENDAGISSRQKVRLRWYDQTLQPKRSQLELKMKQGSEVFKLVTPLEQQWDFAVHSGSTIVDQVRNTLPADLRPVIEQFSFPTLLNSYQREYLLSVCGKVRLTIDRQLTFQNLINHTRINTIHSERSSDFAVFELKAATTDLKSLQSICRCLPSSPRRFSKYVFGLKNATPGPAFVWIDD